MAKTQSGIGQFRLTRGEAIVLVAMQAYMLREDLDAEVGKRVRLQDVKRKLPVVGGSRPTVETKRAEYAQWSDAAVATLTKDVVASGAEWDPGQFTQNGWETLFLDQLASVTDIEEQRARLAQAALVLAQHVTVTARVYLLLIELYSFYPWSPESKVGWVSRARDESLTTLAMKMPAGSDKAFKKVKKEFKRILARLRRDNTNWWKVGGLAVGGAAVGVLTLGLAAPVIGAAIGGFMGLSGAAATSAGLAMLGGGSLAAGGLGMAGGTLIVAGAGGAVAGVAAPVSGYLAGWTAGQVAAETIKLQVLTNLVILQEQGDDVTARLVVEAWNEQLEAVQAAIADLTAKVRALNEDKANLTKENEQLRNELKEQRQELEVAQAVTSYAIDDVTDRLTGARS